jgi:pentatricopeptide repeat protein
VDTYTESPYDEIKPELQAPMWRFVDHVEEPLAEAVPKQFKNDTETLKIIKQLQKQVRVAHPDHEQVWQSYQSLPEPRAPRLPPYLLKRLFHHLSVVEHKSTKSMLRYFVVLEEARAASIPLTKYQWTSAISFAGRHAKRVSDADLEAALQLWRQMEHQAGVKGTSITFNVLFDIATKARKFALAEMVMKEMQSRGLPFTRFFRVSLIQFYGLKGDGDGVRYAYKQFVDAGEIVDSAALTAVIKALLQCGEAVAADQIFARAKALHLEKTEKNRVLPPAINWRQRRKLGRLLDAATRDRAEDSEFTKEVQAAAPLAPTLDTYRALIFHYAVDAGNLDRVTELLNEMKHWGVNMHGGLYMYLFHGFAKHGGVLYTAWTRRRLEQTWNAFTRGVKAEQGSWRSNPESEEATSTKPQQAPMILRRMFDPNPSPSSPSQAGRITFQAPAIYPTRTLVLLVLRAFLKVAGPERTWDIWRESQEIWSPPDEDTKYIEERLEEMLPDHDQSDKSTEEQIYGEIEGMLGHDEEDEENKENMNNESVESWQDTSIK